MPNPPRFELGSGLPGMPNLGGIEDAMFILKIAAGEILVETVRKPDKATEMLTASASNNQRENPFKTRIDVKRIIYSFLKSPLCSCVSITLPATS